MKATMDEISVGTRGQQKNMWGVVVGVIILVLLILFIVALMFKKPKIVSPLPETEDDVRVIFVSPKPSTIESSPETSPSATPKTTKS
ncbi:MAG: hypothetical protein UV61_C0003G0086 [Candidatus Gottesmanbacteria bacterium GW2011_GWB1_43_11]|uniref:Uncharacterized protein n=1 Tax=Candidatus Gottesmanbacteria bacterium GW2011_GWB1_43_11 TaxID=1618446 RepID=A0A0G1FK36_9BACT|nr:MAG: hypothetical protein UV17_C0016G0024 [Candidatus Gottesmanbacteria bacterium GW2011_GWA1_42_26]KKS80986.1 MAG: hypothetical protein UV55_C0024G0010 [Candidatus Gottesmanbacteria bacterium GW2011_GWC1_43_10]KKS87233.1 MAG: hypothetical protein UV61_C0003G0086 [Candidatus Gottesmanbacteria bacterium GW2011_GWB1_43_11]